MYEFISSRGCAFDCTFCINDFLVDLYEDRRIRRRSVENIMLELEHVIEQNPNIGIFHFQDDAFLSCSNTYAEDFSKQYIKRINKPFIIHAIPVQISAKKIKWSWQTFYLRERFRRFQKHRRSESGEGIGKSHKLLLSDWCDL